MFYGVLYIFGRYVFWNVFTGWPGRSHDARVFLNSDIGMGNLLPDAPTVIRGQNIPACIIGDAAYPLLEWLMKPYPGHNLSDEAR